MASEPERGPADDDTVVVQGNGRGQDEEVMQADEEWPVSDLYYVGPDEKSPENEPPEAGAVATSPAAERPARRRFPPDVGVGGLLAVVSVAAALTLGVALLALAPGEPAATAQAPTGGSATTPPPTTTAAPAGADVEVADVEGMTRAQATRALEEQGFRVR